MQATRHDGGGRPGAWRRCADASPGFTLLESAFGMVILALVFISLAAFTKINRKALGSSGKTAQAYAVATNWTEGIKTWYSDTAQTPAGSGQTRFSTRYGLLTASWDTVKSTPYIRDSHSFYTKFTFTRLGPAANRMILARGSVVWDSLATSGPKHTFTWGIILIGPR